MKAAATTFDSRWAPVPAGATELDPGALPVGFRAGGLHAGIKPEGSDVGAIVCDEEGATSVARFTRSAVLAAPVELNLEEAELDHLRCVVANSGNANACTGESGIEVARAMRDGAAAALELAPELVGVASTGVIGVPLGLKLAERAAKRAAKQVDASGAADFSEAIMTTDNAPKRAAVELEVDGQTVRIAGQAKGAGMIAPGLSSATLLAFCETDAEVAPDLLGAELDSALRASFECITVDGQLSTNDSVFLIASGASGATVPDSGAERERFGDALRGLLRALALQVVADGEGASTVTRLLVTGAADGPECERVARAVAGSPLVKTAIYGNDANWGRVIQAAGASIGLYARGRDRLAPSLWLEDVQLCAHGEPSAGAGAARLSKLMKADEIELTLDLHRGDRETEVFFADLTPTYIKINSEYTT